VQFKEPRHQQGGDGSANQCDLEVAKCPPCLTRLMRRAISLTACEPFDRLFAGPAFLCSEPFTPVPHPAHSR
jgi:hypothetical protein